MCGGDRTQRKTLTETVFPFPTTHNTHQYGKDTGIPWLRDAEDDDSRHIIVKFARCFSLRQNYRRLMAPPRSGPFLCLDAVRVLSMLMILLGHTLYFEQSIVGLTNPHEAMGFHNRGFLSTGVGLIANGCLFGVDTFLALAGFLAVLLFMKELGKVCRITCVDIDMRRRRPPTQPPNIHIHSGSPTPKGPETALPSSRAWPWGPTSGATCG